MTVWHYKSAVLSAGGGSLLGSKTSWRAAVAWRRNAGPVFARARRLDGPPDRYPAERRMSRFRSSSDIRTRRTGRIGGCYRP